MSTTRRQLLKSLSAGLAAMTLPFFPSLRSGSAMGHLRTVFNQVCRDRVAAKLPRPQHIFVSQEFFDQMRAEMKPMRRLDYSVQDVTEKGSYLMHTSARVSVQSLFRGRDMGFG